MATETISSRYRGIDLWSTDDAVLAMLEGQLAAAAAVTSQGDAIAVAAEAAASRLGGGEGRLIYVGAGTSGRIAVQDGVELCPTYDWPEERLVYVLAGGMEALLSSVEDAEDDAVTAKEAIGRAGATSADVVIGVAASGRTPFTVSAVEAATAAGALTIGIANNADTPLLKAAVHPILLDTGAEVVAGSTRMKAGTAQKIALNLFSTAVMLRLGRIHDGLMVNMRMSNRKLRDRGAAMVSRIGGADRAAAERALEKTSHDIKAAVLVAMGAEPGRAAIILRAADHNLRAAIKALTTRDR